MGELQGACRAPEGGAHATALGSRASPARRESGRLRAGRGGAHAGARAGGLRQRARARRGRPVAFDSVCCDLLVCLGFAAPRVRGRSSAWLERRPVKPEVAGSIPVVPASFPSRRKFQAPRPSHTVRALVHPCRRTTEAQVHPPRGAALTGVAGAGSGETAQEEQRAVVGRAVALEEAVDALEDRVGDLFDGCTAQCHQD